ncbi:MAG: alpha/beta hydrolase, partial [Pseudomonadota bacterium]
MLKWILGILVIIAAAAAAIAATWWTNRPLVVRHPSFGADCSQLVGEANLDRKVDCIRVWYGTNRKLMMDEAQLTSETADVDSALGEDGGALRLGRADVWLPKLVENGGSRGIGETPHAKGSAPRDQERWADYVFLTRITTTGKETFTSTLQDAVYSDGTDAVLLFVHGFNVEFDEALVRTAQLSNDLSRDDKFKVGVPVLYSWPSAGALSLEDYRGDRDRSLGAAPYLEEFLDLLTEDLDVERINIIAHSMGNRVLTQALEDYARDYLDRHNRDDLEFRILLVAADVERDIFDAANGVFDNLDANVTIYTSDTDRALHVSTIVNEEGRKRLGDTDKNRPYIRQSQNYQTIDATAVATELFGIGHNYYSDNPTILWDMMCTIGETRPQDRALEIARYGGLPDGEEY